MIANNIEVICFLAHTTHLSQPADNIVYKETKGGWSGEVRKYNKNNTARKLPKNQFLWVLCKVLDMALTIRNIMSAFRETGVCPVDRSRIDDKKLAPSRVTDRSK